LGHGFKRQADSREPLQRCNLPLYRIPPVSAQAGAPLTAAIREREHTRRAAISAKKSAPAKYNRGASVNGFRSG